VWSLLHFVFFLSPARQWLLRRRTRKDNNQGRTPKLFMDIEKKITGTTYELLISGRIDGEGANKLEEELLATIRTGANPIYVNLSQATFLCSAGLRVLLQYWRQMMQNQRLLQATRPSPEVDAVLKTSGFREKLVEKM
jgi:anti-anti-sigma factor